MEAELRSDAALRAARGRPVVEGLCAGCVSQEAMAVTVLD